jgi:hypothetical protein
MHVDVTLVGPKGCVVKGNSARLNISLHYACNAQGCTGKMCSHPIGDEVGDRQTSDGISLLEIKSSTAKIINHNNGKARIPVRIRDRSRNHQKQAFVLRVTGEGSLSTGYSNPVTVLSKRTAREQAAAREAKQVTQEKKSPLGTTRKRTGCSPSNESVSRAAQIVGVPPPIPSSYLPNHGADSASGAWASNALELMQEMKCPIVGYETNEHGQPDLALPIRRCAYCRSYIDDMIESPHKSDCRIVDLVDNFPGYSQPHTHQPSATSALTKVEQLDDDVNHQLARPSLASTGTGQLSSVGMDESMSLPSMDCLGMDTMSTMSIPTMGGRTASNVSSSSLDFSCFFPSPRESLIKDLATEGQPKTTTPRQLLPEDMSWIAGPKFEQTADMQR